jgi:histone-lysine N-methyltransferase SETMAR
MEKSNFRFYVRIRQSQGASAKPIYDELKTYAPKLAPSYATVRLWFRKFKRGCKTFEDKPRSGCPISKTSQPNIERIRNLIEDDPYITYDQIEAKTSLSRGTIHTIIHEHLKLRKITSRWVPHELTPKNKEDRVEICKKNLAKFEENKWRLYDVLTGDESWFYLKQVQRKQSNKSWVQKDQSAKTVVRRGRFDAKFMYTIFFKRSGVVHISRLDKGKTVNHKLYINETLKPLVKVLQSKRPETGCKNLKFHHDNARPHVHEDVVAFLEAQDFTIMDHPPYSPDLAPCDFWLFDYIKQRLSDHTSVESLDSEISKIVAAIPRNEWELTFEKLLERMRLCIKFKGDYFEHEINKN